MQPTGGGAPHTPTVPPPPQLGPAGHAPQSSLLPQLSPITPQYWAFICWHISGMQPAGAGAPHRPVTPVPPQVCPVGQPAQSMVLPQPSPMSPQYCPPDTRHPLGVHEVIGAAHTPGTPPPPQIC